MDGSFTRFPLSTSSICATLRRKLFFDRDFLIFEYSLTGRFHASTNLASFRARPCNEPCPPRPCRTPRAAPNPAKTKSIETREFFPNSYQYRVNSISRSNFFLRNQRIDRIIIVSSTIRNFVNNFSAISRD